MAYGNYPNYYQYGPAHQMIQQQQPQMQSSGFVSVRSEEEAFNYPVAYGNSVTFKNENAPYVYTKTMGFSQLDRPVFEKYRLVKEETQEADTEPKAEKYNNSTIDELKSEIKDIWKEIEAIKKEVEYESGV